MLTARNFDGIGNSTKFGDNMISISAGLSFTIGKTGWKRAVDATPYIEQNLALQDYIAYMRDKNAHLECKAPVLAVADVKGSTATMLDYAKEHKETKEYIIATEAGILHELQRCCPDVTFYPVPPEVSEGGVGCSCNECEYMKKNTLLKIYNTLRYELPEVTVDESIAKDAFMTSIPQEKGTGYLKQFQAKMKTSFDPTGKKASEFEFYFGPNDFQILKNTEKESTFGKDLEFQKLVYLGWPIIRWINRFFTLYVFDWLSNVFPMGIVLILITLLLKLITYPMVKKSYMSSAKMRVLKPKLEAATAQFNKPEDQMQKQQATEKGKPPLPSDLPSVPSVPERKSVLFSL